MTVTYVMYIILEYKKMKKIISIFCIAIMLLGMSSCSNEKHTNVSKTQPETKSSDNYYPVKIKTYDFAKEPIELTFHKAPQRVVAIYQNSIETLLALGLQDHIVAAAGLDHDVKDEYQNAFHKVKYYKNVPSKEEMLAMQPDFIVSWYSLFGDKMLGDVKFWNNRGINTYIAQNSGIAKVDTLQNEYNDILNMGKIFNVQDKAKKIVEKMSNNIAKAKKYVAGKQPVKTVILEVEKDGVYRIYGADSIGGDIAMQVGADLVAKKNGQIGNEDLIKLKPDVIFTVYYGDAISKETAVNSIMKNPGLASIPAVQNKRVHSIMLSEVYASGIRTLDGIHTITTGLYPELHKE